MKEKQNWKQQQKYKFIKNHIYESHNIYPIEDIENGLLVLIIQDKENTNNIYLSFRGTKNLNNLLTDINIDPTTYSFGDGALHRGFYKAFKLLTPKIISKCSDNGINLKTANLNFIGHSLGGAVASIAALFFTKNNLGINNKLYTIAAPPAFDTTAAAGFKTLNNLQIKRIEGDNDIIPYTIPMASTYNYATEQVYTYDISNIVEAPYHRTDGYIESIKQNNLLSITTQSKAYYWYKELFDTLLIFTILFFATNLSLPLVITIAVGINFSMILIRKISTLFRTSKRPYFTNPESFQETMLIEINKISDTKPKSPKQKNSFEEDNLEKIIQYSFTTDIYEDNSNLKFNFKNFIVSLLFLPIIILLIFKTITNIVVFFSQYLLIKNIDASIFIASSSLEMIVIIITIANFSAPAAILLALTTIVYVLSIDLISAKTLTPNLTDNFEYTQADTPEDTLTTVLTVTPGDEPAAAQNPTP